MSNQAILIRTGGVAAALLAHAAFAVVLIAAQPRPEHYLAHLAPAPVAAPAADVELARRYPSGLPLVRTLAPTQLLRGTSAC